jgi:hypothetical protein
VGISMPNAHGALRPWVRSAASLQLPRHVCCCPLAGIHTFLNGPESFTSDGQYLLGEWSGGGGRP